MSERGMHRDRKLLDVSHDAPCFLRLGISGCGNDKSVPCHSDMQRHGRGASFKSHDCLAVPGCPLCHAAFTRGNLGREGYEAAWLRAIEAYIVWLFKNDKVKVVA